MDDTIEAGITTLIIARHGAPVIETDHQGRPITYVTDVSLVSIGGEQIENLAKKLRERGITPERVYSSPSKRTRESARILAAWFGLPAIIVEPQLRDIETGLAAPITYKELEKAGGEVYRREALDMTDKRVKHIIARFLSEERGRTVAMFSHGDITRIMRERFERPEGLLPSMREMSKTNYLKPGEAWIFTYDGQGKPHSYDFIGHAAKPEGRTYP